MKSNQSLLWLISALAVSVLSIEAQDPPPTPQADLPAGSYIRIEPKDGVSIIGPDLTEDQHIRSPDVGLLWLPNNMFNHKFQVNIPTIEKKPTCTVTGSLAFIGTGTTNEITIEVIDTVGFLSFCSPYKGLTITCDERPKCTNNGSIDPSVSTSVVPSPLVAGPSSTSSATETASVDGSQSASVANQRRHAAPTQPHKKQVDGRRRVKGRSG